MKTRSTRRRSTRSSRQTPKRRHADSAPTSAQARTIVYVHGIGNKPTEIVLKCQWDRALFGFDLGERSRLAYWVNRDVYHKPVTATCEGGDLTGGATEAEFQISELDPLADGRSYEDEIAALTREPGRRRLLREIARTLDPPRLTPKRDRRRVGAEAEIEVLPLPPPIRRWITRGLTRAFLRDVHDYFFVADRRAAMRERVLERLRVGGGPFVVIGHSLGSVIAYDVLCSVPPSNEAVPLFVTIGSPLGIAEVQDQVKILTAQSILRVPASVARWINVADPVDIVAADKRLAGEFVPSRRIVDHLEWNPDSPRCPHSATGYLRTRPVQVAVHGVVETSLFQPVAPFVVARDVVRDLETRSPATRHPVLIEIPEPADGRSLEQHRSDLLLRIRTVSGADDDTLGIEPLRRFVAATLTREEVEHLASDAARLGTPLRRVWQNAEKQALLDVSAQTVHAVAAHTGYRALGRGISWAVFDTGIAADHPHFRADRNVEALFDATKRGVIVEGAAPDGHGHGTHVAGIIAGRLTITDSAGVARTISGLAPEARLRIYKVLADNGSGQDAWIIKALDHIADANERARSLVVHGINLSLGGAFDPTAYGCGHSPLCEELRRLWHQGVAIVIAAGNAGFAVLQALEGTVEANMDLSIGDPANLDDAIAVGSVHKESPHTYGVSYFSSRGPTADGRTKPDVVAPGERIVSCRHRFTPKATHVDDLYVAMSGTSMAAPHVSGMLAAFLSVRREFIGRPDQVKRLLAASCTDLDRDRFHQGAGLPNLVKMLLNS